MYTSQRIKPLFPTFSMMGSLLKLFLLDTGVLVSPELIDCGRVILYGDLCNEFVRLTKINSSSSFAFWLQQNNTFMTFRKSALYTVNIKAFVNEVKNRSWKVNSLT